MYKWGAAAAYCCARLLVARANRAVIVFAMFRFVFFAQPFSAVVVVFASFVSQSAHTTTNYIKPKQEQSFISLKASCTSTLFAPFFLHLPCPQKNYTPRQKTTPALRLQRRLSAPSFRFAPLWAISVSHPRSTR